MPNSTRELAQRHLSRRWEHLSERERRVIEAIDRKQAIARDTAVDYESTRTFGERLADRIATFGGSWTFILLFLAGLAIWTLGNTIVLKQHAFDAFPYIFLNLFLSMLAALQAPIIMMSQNRQAARDRLDALHDYEVDLKAELEIRSLHEKLDSLREHKWAELVEYQQRQITLLEELVAQQARNRG